jgi:hypothetical protein
MGAIVGYKSTGQVKGIAVSLVCIAVAGCHGLFMDYGEMTRPERQARARARQPYYGTGIVTQVSVRSAGQATNVKIDFRASYAPSLYTQLLTVSPSGKPSGRVELGSWAGEQFIAGILEGEPRVGDLAIGMIHEREFKKQEPDERQGGTP